MSEITPEYSIVIGAYREEKRLPKTLDALCAYLSNRSILEKTEVVLVVAEGNDNTMQVANKYRDVFPNINIIDSGRKIGKGRDIKLGILQAKGEMRLFMDADLATPLHHLDTVFERWNSDKFDVLMGVRDLKTIHSDFLRRTISRIGNTVFFLVGGFYIQDTQCGFKAFSKKAAEECFSRLTRLTWSFDMELLIIAKLRGFKIEQISIPDWQDVPNGTFQSSIKDSLQFFRDLLRILVNRILGVYTR